MEEHADRYAELSRKRFDGELSSGEHRELGELIRRNPGVARQYVVDATMESFLRSRMKTETGAVPAGGAGRIIYARHRGWWQVAAAAAALVAVLGLWVMHAGWRTSEGLVTNAAPSAALQVVSVVGDVVAGADERQMRLAKAGDLLAPGTLVRTRIRNSACTLQLAEKTIQVELHPDSKMIWRGETSATEDGLTIELLSGKVASSVDPTKQVKYTVRTAVGFARAIGTHFTVEVIQTGRTGEKRGSRQARMLTQVTSGIVLVGGLTGATKQVRAGEENEMPARGWSAQSITPPPGALAPDASDVVDGHTAIDPPSPGTPAPDASGASGANPFTGKRPANVKRPTPAQVEEQVSSYGTQTCPVAGSNATGVLTIEGITGADGAIAEQVKKAIAAKISAKYGASFVVMDNGTNVRPAGVVRPAMPEDANQAP